MISIVYNSKHQQHCHDDCTKLLRRQTRDTVEDDCAAGGKRYVTTSSLLVCCMTCELNFATGKSMGVTTQWFRLFVE